MLVDARAPAQLGAIDGPLPDGIMGQAPYAGGHEQYMQVAMGGANGMMMPQGHSPQQQPHAGQGIPGVR